MRKKLLTIGFALAVSVFANAQDGPGGLGTGTGDDGNGDGIDDPNDECLVHPPTVEPAYWSTSSPLRVDEDDQLLPNEGLETECGEVTSSKESGGLIEHTAAGTYSNR